ALVPVARAATVSVASCSQSAVQAAVNSAQNGDTVAVPSGTCTWSSAIELPTKDLTLMGATVVTCSGSPLTCTPVHRTNITCSSSHCFVLPNSRTYRISG